MTNNGPIISKKKVDGKEVEELEKTLNDQDVKQYKSQEYFLLYYISIQMIL